MGLSDLILEAGGVDILGKNFRIELSTLLENDWDSGSYVDIFTVDLINYKKLYDFNDHDAGILNKKLNPGDHVIIRDSPTNASQLFVTVEGEVFFPGKYSISNSNEKISDIIERAGGLKSNAYPTASRF